MEDSRAPREQAPSPLQNTSWSRRSSVVSDLDETQTGLLSESTASRHRSAQTSQASYLPELQFSSFDFDDNASDIASGSKSREYARGNHQEYSNPVHPTFTSSHLGDTHGVALGPAASSHDAVQLQPSDPNRRSSTTTFTGSGQTDEAAVDQRHLAPEESVEKDQHSSPTKYWNPFWLRKSTLLALAALFAGLAVALIVLWELDRAYDGFRPTLTTNHYVWTYGPTAVLTVILSSWRQVDYYCKMMQPWQNLHKGFTDANRSLLLDYISPILFTSLFRAIRYRDIAVAVSVIGFLLLKVIILLSTGLLTLTPVSISELYPVTLTTAFDTAEFWSTNVSRKPIFTSRSGLPPVSYSGLSALPVHAYVKSLREPTEATGHIVDNVVYQSFDFTPVPGLVGMSTEVDTFAPNVSCELATPTPKLNERNHLIVQLDSATCSIGVEHIVALHSRACPTECVLIPNCTLGCREPNKMDDLHRQIYRVNCSDIDESWKHSIMLDVNTSDDLRFAMLVSDLRHLNLTYDVAAHLRGEDQSSVGYTPPQMAAVICKFDYTMQLSAVEWDSPTCYACYDGLDIANATEHHRCARNSVPFFSCQQWADRCFRIGGGGLLPISLRLGALVATNRNLL